MTLADDVDAQTRRLFTAAADAAEPGPRGPQ